MKKRQFKAPSGQDIAFTELGFGAAPIGNLYHATLRRTRKQRLKPPGRRASAISTRPRSMASAYPRRGSTHFLRGKKREDYVISTKVGRLLAGMQAGGAHRHRQILRYAVAP